MSTRCTPRIPCIPSPLNSNNTGYIGARMYPLTATNGGNEQVTSRHLSSVPTIPSVSAALLYTIQDVMVLLRLSKTQIFDEIRRGRIQSVKVGRARRVPAQSLTDFVALLIEEAREVA